MALGSLFGLIGTAAASAYASAIAKKKKETTATPTKTTPTTVTPTSTGNEHANYINQAYSGGMDNYTKLQNDRYNTALQSNDVDLLKRLQADSAKVGYKLSSNVQPINPQLINPWQSELNKNQAGYDLSLNKYKNALDTSVNRGMDNLEAQKGTINQGADEMAKQAYILSRQNAKNMPQQLASRGLSGGATETAQLGLQTNYENNLNNINTNRFNALNSVDTAKTDLKNQGELSYAEQTLANNQAAMAAYKNMLNQSTNFDQWSTEFNANRQDQQTNQTNYLNESANANKQQEYNNILNRLEMGLISPNDAVSLGVPAADVQAYVNKVNQPKVSGGSGGSGGSGTSGNFQSGVIETAGKYLAQGNREKAITALASIMSNAEIKSYLEQNGVRTDDIDWGIEETLPTETNPNLNSGGLNTTSLLITYFKSKGYSEQEIANILNK